ncbi:MAG: DUF2066 domain-containing protein [Gammaproteobacteria bacterium]|nr:DUF2066 domain-containing protein [Gammaproteobacteria bacterium]
MRVWIAALWLLASMLPAAAYAIQVKGLYQAQIPVASEGTQDRTQALRAALERVLIKVSGKRTAPLSPAVAAVLTDPARLIDQYRYLTLPAQTTAGQPAPSSPGLALWVRFDSAAIDRSLRAAQLPIWGRERPAVLLWLAVQDGTQRTLVGADNAGTVPTEVGQLAQGRGLPLVLPLMDLEDQSRVQFGDVWNGYMDNLLEASRRYAAKVILVGQVQHETSGAWSSRWTLQQGGQQVQWASQGQAEDDVLAAGIDGAADTLASRFALAPGGYATSLAAVDVDGVTSLQDYVRVSRYLATLTSVVQVQPYQVDASSVGFQVDARGGGGYLAQEIGLGHTLLPEAATTTPPVSVNAPAGAGAASPATPPVLRYRLAQ